MLLLLCFLRLSSASSRVLRRFIPHPQAIAPMCLDSVFHDAETSVTPLQIILTYAQLRVTLRAQQFYLFADFSRQFSSYSAGDLED